MQKPVRFSWVVLLALAACGGTADDPEGLGGKSDRTTDEAAAAQMAPRLLARLNELRAEREIEPLQRDGSLQCVADFLNLRGPKAPQRFYPRALDECGIEGARRHAVRALFAEAGWSEDVERFAEGIFEAFDSPRLAVSIGVAAKADNFVVILELGAELPESSNARARTHGDLPAQELEPPANPDPDPPAPRE